MASISPLNRLEALLQKRAQPGRPSMMEKIFDIAKKSIGISQSNYLSWNPEYLSFGGYIDGITCEDLKNRQLMWGYDPSERLYIVFQYTVVDQDGIKVRESSTLFERSPNWGNDVRQAGAQQYRLSGSSITEEDCREIQLLFQGSTICKNIGLGEVKKINVTMITDQDESIPSSSFVIRLAEQATTQAVQMAESHIHQVTPLLAGPLPAANPTS